MSYFAKRLKLLQTPPIRSWSRRQGGFVNPFLRFKSTKRMFGYLGTSIASFALVVWGQNCAQTKFENAGTSDYQSVGFDVEEDDLFFKIQNGLATVAELNYSKQRYKDYIELKVSDINAGGVKTDGSHENRDVQIQDVMTSLSRDISANVAELKDMIFNQKLATNSKDVLKKYSELIDLLARARDINNFLILKADIGAVRIDIAKLRTDFNALQASLQEVRNVIIPAMKAELSTKIDTVKSTLEADAEKRDRELRKSLSEAEQRLLAEIREKEAALRADLNAAQKSILDQMKDGNKKIMDDLNAKYSSLIQMMSQQDRDLRDQLNQKYSDLKGQLSESERLQRDLLNSRFNQAMAQMSAQDLALRAKLNQDYAALTSNLDQTKQQLVNQIIEGDNAVRREFDVKMAALKDAMVTKIETTERLVNDRISGVEALSKSNLSQIREIQGIIANIDQRVRETSEQLKALSDKVADDIASINDQFEAIRTAGNANYAEMVKSWNCSEDMIDKQGFEFYGLTSNPSLGVSVSQACVTSKEKVLYSICKERYPTFCGACDGYAEPSACPSWQAMSGKDRLEILLNIRQEVAINHLNEQSRIHSEALYGGASCNASCLNQISDPAVQSVVGQLFTASSGASATCSADEWKKCGLYGVAYSLAVNDANLTNKILAVNNNLSTEIAKLRFDFESEKRSVANRFGILEQELDQKIEVVKKTTEERFLQVGRSMAGLSSASGAEISQELAERSAFQASLAQDAAMKRDLLLQAVAIAMGKSKDVAKASLGGLDEDTLNILANGMMVSSFDILTEIFKTINPDQKSRPYYDTDLQSKVSSACSGHIKFTPFTNVVGRDSHELLAAYFMKSLLMGERSSNSAKNEIYFGLSGVLKSGQLEKNVVGAALDYRTNPGIAAPAACLAAIDSWAKDTLHNSSQFDSFRNKLIANLTLQRLSSLFVDDAKRLLTNLGSIEALIVSTPGADQSKMSEYTANIGTRIIHAAIASRMYTLVANEVESLIAIQRELSKDNGFQSKFDSYLLAYKDSMAQFKAGQQDLANKFNADIQALKASQGAQAAELAKVKDAMGYVYALAQTDPLASDALKQKIKASATVDSTINQLINAINDSGRNSGQIENPFDPVIKAIRHATTGNTSCFSSSPSAGQLPSGSAFYGSWGEGPWGTCQINFRSTSAYKDTVLYRVWGSAHKISYRSTVGGGATVVDFRQPASTSYPVRKIIAGGVAQGVYDAQVPGLLDPVVARGYAYGEGIVEMTPIYVANSGVEKRGTPVVYTMTLYSPLVLDFVNIGAPILTNPGESNVQFDITASGMKETVGWISGRQGALLALDLNNNNRIDDGSELFGEFTKIKADGRRAKHGYEALAQYDDNKDGVIDAKDAIYGSLKLWFDNNHNGKAEKGELVTLADRKVTALSVNFKDMPKERQNMNDNKALYTAKFFGPEQCGTEGCNSYDVYFGTAWKQKVDYLSRR